MGETAVLNLNGRTIFGASLGRGGHAVSLGVQTDGPLYFWTVDHYSAVHAGDRRASDRQPAGSRPHSSPPDNIFVRTIIVIRLRPFVVALSFIESERVRPRISSINACFFHVDTSIRPKVVRPKLPYK